MIRFDDVEVVFGDHRAVSHLDLEIQEGEFFTLLGPSGCGKTTALRTLAGFIEPTGGRIHIAGRDVTRVPSEKRGVGMVFQNYALFPSMNVRENIAFGLSVQKVSKAEQRRRVDEVADRTGLAASQLEKNVAELSGGQQQRVALARALVTELRVLLLDEPLSALDAKVRVQLRDEIRRIQTELGITTFFVTHDQEEALAVSDRIAVMNAGRIEQIGTPEELYTAPSTAGVAAFVGLSSVVSGVAEGDHVVVWGQRLPLQTPADGPVDVYLRPENVHFASEADAATDALVEESTFLGSMRRTLVRTESGELVRVQHAPGVHPAFGDRVRIAVDPEPVVVHPRG